MKKTFIFSSSLLLLTGLAFAFAPKTEFKEVKAETISSNDAQWQGWSFNTSYKGISRIVTESDLSLTKEINPNNDREIPNDHSKWPVGALMCWADTSRVNFEDRQFAKTMFLKQGTYSFECSLALAKDSGDYNQSITQLVAKIGSTTIATQEFNQQIKNLTVGKPWNDQFKLSFEVNQDAEVEVDVNLGKFETGFYFMNNPTIYKTNDDSPFVQQAGVETATAKQGTVSYLSDGTAVDTILLTPYSTAEANCSFGVQSGKRFNPNTLDPGICEITIETNYNLNGVYIGCRHDYGRNKGDFFASTTYSFTANTPVKFILGYTAKGRTAITNNQEIGINWSSHGAATWTDENPLVIKISNVKVWYAQKIDHTFALNAHNLAAYVMMEDQVGQCTTKYPLAKAFFNALGDEQANFVSNSEDALIVSAYERLVAWAAANGDVFDGTTFNSNFKATLITNNGISLIVVVSAMMCLTTIIICAYGLLKKKRQ